MELNPLPDLLNTGFTVIEIGLFCGDEDGNVYLIEEPFCLADVWKYFKYWLSYFT